MPKPKLEYFDFPASRGEECRIALHLAGVDWEDERIKREEWMQRKASTPFGAMPVLEIPGKGRLAHSNAILAFIGRGHDMHPTDSWEAAQHEAILSSAEELRHKATAAMRRKGSDEERKAAREEMAESVLKAWGANVNRMIGDGPFLAGDKLNVADIKLYMIVRWFNSGVVDHVPADVFSEFEKLTALHAAVAAHPQVAEWVDRHR